MHLTDGEVFEGVLLLKLNALVHQGSLLLIQVFLTSVHAIFLLLQLQLHFMSLVPELGQISLPLLDLFAQL